MAVRALDEAEAEELADLRATQEPDQAALLEDVVRLRQSKGKHGGPIARGDLRETMERIILAVRAGNYLDTSASFAGVSKDQFHRWLQRGNGKSPTTSIFGWFRFELSKALAEAEMRHIMIIQQAAKEGVWQAAAWMLERKFPTKWGRRDRLDLGMGLPEEEKVEDEVIEFTIQDGKGSVVAKRILRGGIEVGDAEASDEDQDADSA